jgi:hypothetical protein
MCFNYITQTKSVLYEGSNILFAILSGILTLIFVTYCIIIGLQEIKSRQIIEARYFEIFGILFEVIIFVGGLFLGAFLLQQQIDVWKIGLLILWQLGLLILLIVDLKRIRTS